MNQSATRDPFGWQRRNAWQNAQELATLAFATNPVWNPMAVGRGALAVRHPVPGEFLIIRVFRSQLCERGGRRVRFEPSGCVRLSVPGDRSDTRQRMRKQIINQGAQRAPAAENQDWLDLEHLVQA
jgi:hypothetical protein